MAQGKFLIAGALAALVAYAPVPAVWAADDLLQTIKSRGVIRTCSVDYAPWNIKNPASNQWEGVNVDIMNLAAGILKVKVEQVDATWGTVVPSVLTQKCDVAAAGALRFGAACRAHHVHATHCDRRHLALCCGGLAGQDGPGPRQARHHRGRALRRL